MLGLKEIIRINELAVKRNKENLGARLDEFTGLINCLKHPGLIPQCSRCPNETTCLQISQALC